MVSMQTCIVVGAPARRGDGDIENGEQMDNRTFEEGVVFKEIDFKHDFCFGVSVGRCEAVGFGEEGEFPAETGDDFHEAG